MVSEGGQGEEAGLTDVFFPTSSGSKVSSAARIHLI